MWSRKEEEEKMKIKKELLKREVMGDCFLVPLGKTVYENNGLFALNELGAFIWDLLPDVETEAEIVSAVLKEYDIDEATAEQDVSEFVSQLKEMGIL